MAQVIGFHFTLTDQFGTVLGSTAGKQDRPMLALLGAGNILPAVEQQIAQMNIGQSKRITIPAAQAYGEIDPSLKLKLPRSKFPQGTEITIGLQFQGGERDDQPVIFRVTEIKGDDIYVDANHELAGRTLHYDVKITHKREASSEERAHGHAHHQNGACG